MSCSTLYLLDKDMKIEKTKDFDNAWVMSPQIWSILYNKYLYTEFNMFLTTGESMNKLIKNTLTNGSSEDVLACHISFQQIISLKNKDKLMKLLKDFSIKMQPNNRGLQDRINELIFQLLHTNSKYFIWKNTSVDNAVENKFDEDGNLDFKNCEYFEVNQDGEVISHRL